MKKNKIKQIMLVLVILGVLSACKKDEKKVEAEIVKSVKYETVVGDAGGFNQRFSGSIKPKSESNLSFKVGGSIEKIYVKIGDKVKKGQLLAVLDKNNYRLQVQQAEAMYEQVKASTLTGDLRIDEAKTGIAQAKTGITQAKSAVEQAEAAYTRAVSIQNTAKQDYERYRKLYLNDNIAQNIFDNSKSNLEQTTAAVEQALAAINQAKAVYEQTIAKQDQTKTLFEQSKAGKIAINANLKSATTQLELAKLQHSYTELRAPADGTIAMQMAEENENIGAGTPIFRIDGDNSLQAEIYVSESIINKIKLGDSTEIFIDSLKDTFIGTVVEIGSSSTGYGGTYIIKVAIDKLSPELKVGMAAEVKFNFKEPNSAEVITLPMLAVNEDINGEKFAYVIENLKDREGVVVKKKLTIGKIINNRIEILSGLKENEKVVTAGSNRVIPGQKVKLYEEVK